MKAVVAPKKKRSLFKHPAVRIGLSLLVLGLLFTALPFADIAAAIKRVPPIVWPTALALYMTTHLIGVAKWRLLVNAAGAGLSFRTAARAYYMGLFGNTFLPSIVGGDVVRAGVALRATKSKSGLVLGSLVDRLLDITGLAAVAGVGALLSPRALDAQSRRIFLMLGAVIAVAGVGAIVFVSLLPVRRLPWKVRRRLVDVRNAIRATAKSPIALVSAFLMGMALQSLLTVLNWWLGRVIGIDIPIYVWLFVWPLAKVAGLLPLTQNGIGVREAAQAALFAPFGVPATAAVATGLVFEVVIITGGLLGGVVAWLLRLPPLAHENVSPMVTDLNASNGPMEDAADCLVDVVIPVLNEARVLASSVAEVRRYLGETVPWRWRVVVVDNGSTDGTDEVARALVATYDDVRFLQLPQRGRGRALRHAWMQSDADIMCYTDVDLSTELAALPVLVHALRYEGYDLATGSRLLPESRTRRSFKREFISRSYNLIVKLVLGTSFSDAQCGFKVVTREVVREIIPQVQDESWFFDTELLVLAEKQNYRLKDLAVEWIEDDDSRVKIVKTALDDLKGVWRLRVALWRNAFAPKVRASPAVSKRVG